MFTSQKNLNKQKWEKPTPFFTIPLTRTFITQFQINKIVTLNKKSQSYNKLCLDHDHIRVKLFLWGFAPQDRHCSHNTAPHYNVGVSLSAFTFPSCRWTSWSTCPSLCPGCPCSICKAHTHTQKKIHVKILFAAWAWKANLFSKWKKSNQKQPNHGSSK